MSWILQGLVAGALLAYRGQRKKSLSKSGAVAGFVVAVLSWGSGPDFGLTLLFFYQTGSWLTKFGAKRKMALDANNTECGERGALQVLSCSAVATVLAVAYRVNARSWLLSSFVSFYACCAGDTWASEVGTLATTPPRLITTLRPVPPGTNGGVTAAGFVASAAAGVSVGLFYASVAAIFRGGPQDFVRWGLLGLCAGFVGSLADSLMGATLQRTRYDADKKRIVKDDDGDSERAVVICGRDILSNHTVNFLTATLTAAAGPFLDRAVTHCLYRRS